MLKKTFVIIATYNAMPWLSKCLESTKPFNVVVVDNNSTDETVKFIKENYPSITILAQKENLGFGKANNIGITFALGKGAEQVFLLNQDAYLVNDAMNELMNVCKDNPAYGILSPVHLNGKGTALDSAFLNYMSNANVPLLLNDLLTKNSKGVYEVPFVNAAGWLITKKCLETVGGFDPIFFHYGEDINFYQRVNYFNLKGGVVFNAFMIHDRVSSKIREGPRFSDLYFFNLERRLKMQWADINKDQLLVNKEIVKKIQTLKKEKLKAYLKLKLSSIKHINKELNLIHNIVPSIFKSRTQNESGNTIF
jgi:GT2 family glycosyltransferase